MTPQEAIEIITNAIQAGNVTVEQDMALAMAQKALEKQIPNKPITIIAEKDEKIGARVIHKGTHIYKCPICNGFFSRINKHCGCCGQALDWRL